MNINITAKKFELTPSIKEYVEERIEGMSKFFDKITEARVILEVDDGHHKHGDVNKCEIILRVPGQKDVFAEEWTDEMHKSINQATSEAERELKKVKDKLFGRDDKELRKLKEEGFDQEEDL